MIQSAAQHCTHVHFERLVAHIADHPGLRLQLEVPVRDHWTGDLAVDHDMRHPDFTLDFGLLADHERARFAGGGDRVAMHLAVDPQTAGECHIAIYDGTGADEAVDAFLRRRALPALPHGDLLTESQCCGWRAEWLVPTRTRGP